MGHQMSKIELIADHALAVIIGLALAGLLFYNLS
jgi:hypothetical protein